MECFDDIDGTWFRKNEGDPWVAKFSGNKNYAYIHIYIRDKIITIKYDRYDVIFNRDSIN